MVASQLRKDLEASTATASPGIAPSDDAVVYPSRRETMVGPKR